MASAVQRPVSATPVAGHGPPRSRTLQERESGHLPGRVVIRGVLASQPVGSRRRPDASDAEDAANLAACAEGCHLGFEALHRRYSGRCWAAAMKVVHDRHLAEDVVQEAFLAAWRSAATFDARQSTVDSWLVMLTHRRAVDRVRYEQSRAPARMAVMDRPTDVDVAELVATRLESVQTRALLTVLPECQRRCVVLAYWGGYTMAEIAVLVDAPVGTVKTRIHAGIRALRRAPRYTVTDRAATNRAVSL